jgi:hypothetical protein
VAAAFIAQALVKKTGSPRPQALRNGRHGWAHRRRSRRVLRD